MHRAVEKQHFFSCKLTVVLRVAFPQFPLQTLPLAN